MEMPSLLIKLVISWLNSYSPIYQVFHHSEKIALSVPKRNVYGLIITGPHYDYMPVLFQPFAFQFPILCHHMTNSVEYN